MKIKHIIPGLLAGLVALSSCSKDCCNDGSLNNVGYGSDTPIQFESNIIPRDYDQRNGDTYWHYNDEIGVFMYRSNEIPQEALLAANKHYKTSNSTGTFVASAIEDRLFFPQSEGNVGFLAYAPYQANVKEMTLSVDVSDQLYLKNNDLLYSNKLELANSKTPKKDVRLDFDHMMAKIVFKVSRENMPTAVNGLTAKLKGMSHTASFNLANAAFSDYGDPKEIQPLVESASTMSTVSSVILPVKGLKNGAIEFITPSQTYIWHIPEGQEYKSKHLYIYELILLDNGGVHAVNPEGTISDWAVGGEETINIAGGEEQNSLTLTPNTATLPATGGSTEQIRVNTDAETWQATVAADASSWCTLELSMEQGKPVGFVLTATANNGPARTASINVVAGNAQATFTLSQEGQGIPSEFTPISQILALGSGLSTSQGSMIINDDLKIQAVVTTDYHGKQFPFKAYHHIQDEAGTAIVMTIAQGGTPYEFGDKLTCTLKGAKLTNYYGTLQVELTNDKVQAEPGHAIAPKEVTIKEILDGKYPLAYVKVDGIQFKEYQGMTFYQGTSSTYRNKMVNRAGEEIALETYKYSLFKDEALPAESGHVIAVVTVNVSNNVTYYNIRPSTRADIKLTEPRF